MKYICTRTLLFVCVTKHFIFWLALLCGGAHHKPALINIVPQHNTNNVTRKFNTTGNAPFPYTVQTVGKLLYLVIVVIKYYGGHM